jgi:hypothetical protein
MIAHLRGGNASTGLRVTFDTPLVPPVVGANQESSLTGDSFASIIREEPFGEVEQVAEVFVEFAEPVVSKAGRAYIARACGSETDHDMWQGWVEFLPVDGRTPIRSGRETTQPNRQDTEYWATGLTPVYLEGALDRALNPLTRVPAGPEPEPVFSTPAPDAREQPAHESVLNPFSVYRKGEALLRSQLLALSGWHLVNIITAYSLSQQREADLTATPAPILVELIVSAVRERAAESTSTP